MERLPAAPLDSSASSEKPAPTPAQRYRRALTVAAPVALVVISKWRGASPPPYYAAGLALAVLGQWVRIWAAGTLVKDQQLARRGVFARCRNPLYLGSFIIGAGHCLMSGLPWSIPVLLPLFGWVYFATIRAEEEYLQTRFGAEFTEYCARTPRLRPRLRADSPPLADFSWRHAFTANREHEALISNAVVALLFAWPM